jgi:hypothetical protein
MIRVLAGESAAFIRLEADVLVVGGGPGGSRDNAHSLSHPRFNTYLSRSSGHYDFPDPTSLATV